MLRMLWGILLIFRAFSNSAFSAEQAPVPPAPEAQAREEPPKTILRDGTPVQLRITRTVSTATAKVGDRVEFEVVQDVKVGDLLVIPRRAIAWGSVSQVEPKRRPSRNAVLSLRIEAVKAVTDDQVPLRGSRAVTGGLTSQQVIERTFEFLPMLVVLKGYDAFISKGGKVEAYINGETTFDSARLRKSMASLEAKKAAALAAATAGKAEIHIYRHVPDVVGGKPKIYLDGIELARMQGDRYFNVLLEPGVHTFRSDASEIAVDCKAGQEYYLRVERQGSFFPKAYFFLVPISQGEDEIYPLTPSDPKDILDHSRIAVSHIEM